jgi:DNA invertase Pin-like site-specific DNA recombinase
MTKAAVYARVSTGRQAERDLSIPDQLRQLEGYCAGKGFEVVRSFVEPGASAKDDRRPVFQEMIAEALGRDRPFAVIVVLTTSRFFRDATQARVYKAKLAKAGVRVVAVHQEVSDDPMGGFIEGVFELIDQYESDINGFHTLRAMKENARQGYYNGSRPKYGFRAVAEAKILEDQR